MVRPRCSRRRNSSQVAHCGTRLELAMSTRGAHSCVLSTPTGLPDWTRRVSSPLRAWEGGGSGAVRCGECFNHGGEATPARGGRPGAAVDDELVGMFGHLGV